MERDKLHWEEVRKTWQASVDQDRDRQEKRANVSIGLLLPCPSMGPNRFWLGTNCFGQVPIIFFWTNFYNLELSKMIGNLILDP